MSYPTGAAPSWYGPCSWASVRHGTFYEGTPVTVTLSKAGATAYAVIDWWGNTVETGTVSSTSVPLTTTFVCGWYRFHATGPNTDTIYGNAYSATQFIVVPTNTHLPTASLATPGNGAPGKHLTPMDFGYRACMGLGIDDLASWEFRTAIEAAMWKHAPRDEKTALNITADL